MNSREENQPSIEKLKSSYITNFYIVTANKKYIVYIFCSISHNYLDFFVVFFDFGFIVFVLFPPTDLGFVFSYAIILFNIVE